MHPIELKSAISPPYKKISFLEKKFHPIEALFTNHPYLLLISGIACIALGIAALSLSASILPLVAGGVLLGLGLTLLTGTSIKWRHVLAYLIAVPILTCLGINSPTMKNHRFEERSCLVDGTVLGKISYDTELGKDVPVLELKSANPFEMGFIQGYLLGDKIEELTQDVLRPMVSFSQLLVGDFRGKILKNGIKNLIIPKEYLEELSGIYKGLEKYCKERNKPMVLSLNEILLAHQFADIYKSIGCQKIFGIKFFNSFGCTTVAAKSSSGNSFVARTLDWPGFIKGGEHMLVRRYPTSNGMTVETHTLPGIIHALTAKNNYGLISIINELGNQSLGGIPYGLFARSIIEHAKTLDEARSLVIEKLNSPIERPASSHHLTLIDSKDASNFQFYADPKNTLIERKLSDTPEGILIVTNHAIDKKGSNIPNTEADYSSHAREKAVRALYEGSKKDITRTSMKRYLNAANVADSIAAVVYETDAQLNTVSVEYAHAVSFAAKCLS